MKNFTREEEDPTNYTYKVGFGKLPVKSWPGPLILLNSRLESFLSPSIASTFTQLTKTSTTFKYEHIEWKLLGTLTNKKEEITKHALRKLSAELADRHTRNMTKGKKNPISSLTNYKNSIKMFKIAGEIRSQEPLYGDPYYCLIGQQ